MGEIYSNARDTIPCGRSADSLGGCFTGERNPRPIQLCDVAPGWKDSDGLPVLLYASSAQTLHNWVTTRAWALQKSVLSPRVLYFDFEQIFWRCNTNRVGLSEI